MREMRTEVNAYAGAILVKLLAIVNDVPGGSRGDVQRIEREIREMLAFVDPQLADDLGDLPLSFDVRGESAGSDHDQQRAAPTDERIDELVNQLQQADLQAEASIELLRDLRMGIYSLRDDLRTQHEQTTEALQSLTSTTRSLHYTITALSARSEQMTDLSGVAQEQIRVGVWKYALIAGISSGAIVAAIVAFLSLVV
jgi:methyl-accepting chemotaxis protein